ncbi:MAG: ATP-binding cassette domain-containing protein [Desulfobacteraceae bacterium]|jgi:phosphonate transport system ATP-binding protein
MPLLVQAQKQGPLSSTVDSDAPRLCVASLCKSYAGRGAVLEDVSFRATQGESVALIGGNGSGKSTLLRCCLRLIEPDRGDIHLLGEPITALNGARLRRLRSQVGLVFQRHNLVPRFSVLTNVIHGAMGRTCGMKTWIQGIAPRHLRDEAMTCLDKVGLGHLAASKASRLSGGESQRVAIARALMQRPHLMMADEPVASLDPKVGREVMELFIELIHKENITLVYVSHDLDHALHYSEKLLGLRHGKLAIDGNTSDFAKRDLNAIYH